MTEQFAQCHQQFLTGMLEFLGFKAVLQKKRAHGDVEWSKRWLLMNLRDVCVLLTLGKNGLGPVQTSGVFLAVGN